MAAGNLWHKRRLEKSKNCGTEEQDLMNLLMGKGLFSMSDS